MLICTKEVHN